MAKIIRKQDTKWKAKVKIGINVSIICIETLFLAEYCAFGWVVGTFFWVFWFCFAIAWKFAGGRRRPSASSDPPANFQAIAKKIKISEKSANYQPNAQYQPKKRLYLYNIFFPFYDTGISYSLEMTGIWETKNLILKLEMFSS